MRRAASLLFLEVGLLALGACTSTGETAVDSGGDADAAPRRSTTTERIAEDPDQELCAAFGTIIDMDDRVSAIMSEALATADSRGDLDAALREMMDEMVATQPEILAAYSDLVQLVPAEYTGDVDILLKATIASMIALDDVTSLDQVEPALSQVLTPDEMIMAGDAALHLDQLSRERCDLVFADT